MKRFLAVLAVAAIAAVSSVAAATGGHKPTVPSMRQFKALQKQVTLLNKHQTALKSQVSGLNDQVGALSDQVAGLNSQMTSLTKQVTTLKNDDVQLQQLGLAVATILVDCVSKEVPVDQVGDATNAKYGYAYTDATSATSFATALDWSASPTKKTTWLPAGNAACVKGVNGSSMKHLAALAHAR